MQKKLGYVSLGFVLSLSLISAVACSSLTTEPVTETLGYDICTSGLEIYELSNTELLALSEKTLDQMVLTNCTLHQECEYPMKDPSICE